MIDLIGFWVALTVIVAPTVLIIGVHLEQLLLFCMKDISSGRFTPKGFLWWRGAAVWKHMHVNLWGDKKEFEGFIQLLSLICLYICSITVMIRTLLDGATPIIELAHKGAWLIYPVTIIGAALLTRKTLKAVVSFGYSVKDKLATLDEKK